MADMLRQHSEPGSEESEHCCSGSDLQSEKPDKRSGSYRWGVMLHLMQIYCIVLIRYKKLQICAAATVALNWTC